VLTGGAYFFSKDANELVLEPLQSMFRKVQRIAENPMEAAQMEEQQAFIESQIQKENEASGKKLEIKKEDQFETAILEKTIIKVGALLAVGFGEAGSEIIAKNMSKGSIMQ